MAVPDKEKDFSHSVHTTEKQVFRSDTALAGAVSILQVINLGHMT